MITFFWFDRAKENDNGACDDVLDESLNVESISMSFEDQLYKGVFDGGESAEFLRDWVEGEIEAGDMYFEKQLKILKKAR
jgi:hypothetical protein